eukprot:TRINITY_DN49365_c0_g1_i1.p1 TRINITY_DN49365_c0_g1~~TRINITY_DN49365_c0_g1_i1.p1  ORF type:complete len:559 (-),score=47.95 TRINITY_DN49365_c0_g1_i1:119-1795(-)
MAKSMNYNQAAGLGGMLKDGHKSFSGIGGAVLKNIEAAKGIASMVNTSLGPNGMNKLVVNHLEKIIVTSDCAAIVRELEVQHPAAKMLVLAAEMQQNEYGDNTNLVISFAGELLKLAEDLLKQGLHVAEIVAGYQRAFEKTKELLPTFVCKTVDNVLDKKQLQDAIKSVLTTKQCFGNEELLSNLVVSACLTTLSPSVLAGKGKPKLNLDSVRLAKLRGGSLNQSDVIKGMVILRDTEGIVKYVKDAKVAVFNCGIEAASSEAKGTVLLKNANELLNYNKSEERKMEELIESISNSGVNVVISHGSVSEMALHFLDKFNIMVIKIQSKFELRRICGTLGTSAVMRLGPVSKEEIGECSLIEVREISSRKVTVFEQKQDEDTSIATIVVRASTEHLINDVERSIDDGIHAVEALFSDARLLPGAGAVELELSKRLKIYATETATAEGSLDQYAIRKFAEAFDVIPRTIAENSGCDPSSIMHELHLSHIPDNTTNIGFDINTNKPCNVTENGIYDIFTTKMNALRLATDAAITVLRVDQIVMSKPAGGPKAPQQGGGPPM